MPKRTYTRRAGQPKAEPTISLSVRLTPAEITALHTIAERIGNGASATGVIRQCIVDRIKAEQERQA
jgi:hypothetical protein